MSNLQLWMSHCQTQINPAAMDAPVSVTQVNPAAMDVPVSLALYHPKLLYEGKHNYVSQYKILLSYHLTR